jgi:hypothetical protein
MDRHVLRVALLAAAVVASTPASMPAWRADAFAQEQPQKAPQPAPGRQPVELQTLKDMAIFMEICWRANLPAHVVPGLTIRMMVNFKRDGEVFGEPKFTFVTHDIPMDTKAEFQRAAASALARCNPMPFSESLGNAVAGRPWVFEFKDRRNEKGT